MKSLNQLENYTSELATAAKDLADLCRDAGLGSTPALTLPRDAPLEVHRARRNVLAAVARVQTLLAEPADFIQQLASQNQLLACLRWLGEFQVLACIPLSGSVPLRDVAELAGVPEHQLCRIVRMTATAGFLQEPQPGYIAHTALSAPFVTKLFYLDAAMFLAETAAPTALQMASATQRSGNSEFSTESAYNTAFNTPQSFAAACKQRTKLQRQWAAYRRCAGEGDSGVVELLSRLDWRSLGSACIVDVGAQSTSAAAALSELYPALRFIVQMNDPVDIENGGGKAGEFNPRITVDRRSPASPQTVKDAAVYILRLPSHSPGIPSRSLPARILAELAAHLGILRTNSSAALVLVPHLLPEPGTVDPDVEALARLRDLSRLQLANEREMEMGELVDLVHSVHDGMGRLVVVNKLRTRNSTTVALGVKYQTYADGLDKNIEPSFIL
ncbi:O-methyltransferase family protein [Biscogniauxia mediterranea]|nr:O-methyltransferase family protein [Biscogniauxia mediterranea]